MTDMTKEGEKIHAYWYAMVALFVVLGKMTRNRAMKEAYKLIAEEFGEDTLMKEFELDINGNPAK
jgi:hypothetical protein